MGHLKLGFFHLIGISDLNSNLPQAREGKQALRASVDILKLLSNDSSAAV